MQCTWGYLVIAREQLSCGGQCSWLPSPLWGGVGVLRWSTARPPPQPSPTRGEGDERPCREKAARGCSFHHLRHDEEMILARRRIAEDRIGIAALGHHVGP